MKAAVYHGKEDVRIESVDEPAGPGPDDVIVQVARATICGTDVNEFVRGASVIPLERRHPASGHVGPLVIGHEFMGRVVAGGRGVTALAEGDRVACGAGISCGSCAWCRSGRTNLCATYVTVGIQRDGGLAELVRAPASTYRPVPEDCTDDAAALSQPLSIALHALDRADPLPAETLVVIGAGGIGAFVIAAARSRGIERIVAVDISATRLARAEQVGATDLLDALKVDAVESLRELTGGIGADVVIEASGAPTSLGTALAATRRGGRVLMLGTPPTKAELDVKDAVLREVELRTAVAHICDHDLPVALEMLRGGALAAALTDRTVPLDRLVPDGLQALAAGTVEGKILVDPEQSA